MSNEETDASQDVSQSENQETKTLTVCYTPEELKQDAKKLADLLEQFEAEGSEEEWKEAISRDDYALLHALASIFETTPVGSGLDPKATHVFFMMISLDAPSFCPIIASEYKIIQKTIFASNEVQWYYRDKEHKNTLGPLTKEQLKAASEAKMLDLNTYVWHDKLSGWTKVSDLPDLTAFLTAPAPPPSSHRRVSKAQNLIVGAKFDETLIQRLTILYTILKNVELASLTFEEGEIGSVMSEHLQLMANPNQEIAMLAAECLFLLDQIEGEKNLLRERASVHANAPHFKNTLLLLLDRDDKDPVLVPSLEFVEQIFKHGPTKGRDAFFRTADANQIMNSLWAHLKLSEHDPVLIQCLLCCDAMLVCEDYPDTFYSLKPDEILTLCNRFLEAHEGDQLLQDLVQSCIVKCHNLEKQLEERQERKKQEDAKNQIAKLAAEQKRREEEKLKEDSKSKGSSGESKEPEKKKKLSKSDMSEAEKSRIAEIEDRRNSMFSGSGSGGDGKELKLPFLTIDLFQLQTYEANPDSIRLNSQLLIEKHKNLSEMMQHEGTEDEWKKAITARNFELLHTIALLLTNVDLDDDQSCLMIETLLGLLSLTLDTGTRFMASLPNFLTKFSQTIKPDLDTPSLLLRLRLLSTIFLYSKPKDIKVSNVEDFCDTLLNLLSNNQEDIFGLIVVLLLLLNALDLDKKLLITKGLDHQNNRELSEAVPLVVNKGENPVVELAAVNFVEQVFRVGRGEFFFTNDIFVLIDILTRLIKDANKNSPLLDYLNCYGQIVLWSEYPSHRYKVETIIQTLNELVSNTTADDTEQDSSTTQILETTEQILSAFLEMNPQ